MKAFFMYQIVLIFSKVISPVKEQIITPALSKDSRPSLKAKAAIRIETIFRSI